jgi:glyoxylase-like metal-dependent hydrolase (beta-lactamase superfamily II)
VFLDEERGVALGGDHLLARISSNPLIQRPLGGRSGDPASGRPRALLMYLDSLRATRADAIERVLPGHGEDVEDHVALIDERFALHERRAAKLAQLIRAQPRSAHELAYELWGNVAVTQAYLTLSEVLGHVDLLMERGEVAEEEIGGVVRFAAAR